MAIATSPKTRSILYIEDDSAIGTMYQRALGQAGFSLTLEPDGKKGLSLAQSDNFDFILLDLVLPNMSGVEILRHLRNPNRTVKLHSRVIVLTNLEQEPKNRLEIEQHADGYFVKADITPNSLANFLIRL